VKFTILEAVSSLKRVSRKPAEPAQRQLLVAAARPADLARHPLKPRASLRKSSTDPQHVQKRNNDTVVSRVYRLIDGLTVLATQ